MNDSFHEFNMHTCTHHLVINKLPYFSCCSNEDIWQWILIMRNDRTLVVIEHNKFRVQPGTHAPDDSLHLHFMNSTIQHALATPLQGGLLHDTAL